MEKEVHRNLNPRELAKKLENLYAAFANGKILQYKLEVSRHDWKWIDYLGEACPRITTPSEWRVKPITRRLKPNEVPFVFVIEKEVLVNIKGGLGKREIVILRSCVQEQDIDDWVEDNVLYSIDGINWLPFTKEVEVA